MVALKFPGVFTMPGLSVLRDSAGFKLFTQVLLAAAYTFALLNLILRNNKILGVSALGVAIAAGLIGAAPGAKIANTSIGLFFGLDFFVINMLFTGFLFIPLERWLPRLREQRLFRNEWREDLFYYLVSSMMVQVLTFLTMAPSNFLLRIDTLHSVQLFFGACAWLLQLLLIMIFTDTVQYWLHRGFHRVPFLWGFHAVLHSAKSMDWMAGAGIHFLEIIVLRSVTAIPMFTLGFDPSALQAYVLLVYVYSSVIHANVGVDDHSRSVAFDDFYMQLVPQSAFDVGQQIPKRLLAMRFEG
jgi:sterol desaturase/sphingolipid hydroxylase (fatty acid hydroxylase superfamily)